MYQIQYQLIYQDICGTPTGKITINPTAFSTPSSGVSGGIGDKIILFNGGTGVYPYSIGINANMLWMSIPTSATYSWYVTGVTKMSLSTTGVLNVAGNLRENGIDLSSKYLLLTGDYIDSNSVENLYISSKI